MGLSIQNSSDVLHHTQFLEPSDWQNTNSGGLIDLDGRSQEIEVEYRLKRLVLQDLRWFDVAFKGRAPDLDHLQEYWVEKSVVNPEFDVLRKCETQTEQYFRHGVHS